MGSGEQDFSLMNLFAGKKERGALLKKRIKRFSHTRGVEYLPTVSAR